MYDILLINPVKIRDSYALFPLGTLTLATILNEKGFKVRIIDFNYLWEKGILEKDKSVDELIEDMSLYIIGLNAKVIGFSTNSSCHHTAIELSRRVKEKSDSKVFFGGHQSSLTAKDTLGKFPWIDLISVGEGELNIALIVDALMNNKSLDNIDGIVYRRDKEIIRNKDVALLEDLDSMPMLNYDLTNVDIEIDKNNNIAFPIEVGRSCPFSCTFCCTKTFWKQKFRMKSTERLIAEIEDIIERYGVYNFHFLHDLFTFKKDKVFEFCRMVKEKNLKIRWICSIRIDTVNEELIKAMSEAGCQKVFLGIETASPNQQKRIRKNLNVDSIWENVDIIKKYNIKVEAGFMYGFPHETKEDVNMTLNMMIKGARKGVWFPEIGILNVENGTELYDELKNDLYVAHNIDNIYLCDKEEFEYFFDMFNSNPEIFPHFYDFNNATRQRYAYLDKFMWIVVSMIFLGFKTSLSFLVSIYKNDVLNIYDDVIKYCKDIFVDIFVENFAIAKGNEKDLVIKRTNLIKELINNMPESISKDVVSEVFDLEKNIVFLRLYGSENEEVNVKYEYDILKFKKYGMMDDKKGIYNINLVKVDSNRIKIQGAI